MFEFGVFFGSYFLAFGVNQERYGVSLRMSLIYLKTFSLIVSDIGENSHCTKKGSFLLSMFSVNLTIDPQFPADLVISKILTL